MKIDCDSCTQRPVACGECVVSLFLSMPSQDGELETCESQAIEVLANVGLVPKIRMQQASGE
jgi:hypothetical protein